MEIFVYDVDELVAARTALAAEATSCELEASWRGGAITQLLAGPDEAFSTGLAQLVLDRAVADKVDALLSGWRRDARTIEHIAGLLEDAGTPHPGETARAIGSLAGQRDHALRTTLYAATALRDEEGTHETGRLMLLRRQLLIVGVVLVCILFSLLALAIVIPVDLQGSPAAAGKFLWLYVAVFGAFGGGASAFRALSSRVSRRRVPKHLLSSPIALVRPLLGAIPALAAYVMLESGVLGFKPATTAAVLAMAFTAGFTERLIVRAVEPPDLSLEEPLGLETEPPRAARPRE